MSQSTNYSNLSNVFARFERRDKSRLRQWLSYQLVGQKFNTPAGWVFLALLAVLVAAITALFGIKIAGLAIAGIIGLFFVGSSFLYPFFGIFFTLGLGWMISPISKFSNAPIGTAMDGMIVIMSFGILVLQTKERDWSFLKSPISVWAVVWIVYNLIQVLNPWAESKLAWVFTVRSVAVLLIFYFITLYTLKSLDHIKKLLKYLIFLILITALYGLKQEFLGFSSGELAWIYADQDRFELFFQWTRFRIFSLLNDPTTYGIMMAYGGLMCFCLSIGPYTQKKKVWLVIFGLIMIWVTAYTGTRTAYALIPAGFAMFIIMTLKKEVLIVTALMMPLAVIGVMKSSSNPLIYRIQSAFRPGQDASVQVRIKNQKFIQPFIWKHPIGAGLGSTGIWGMRFTPDSMLASFAHDSGFVRVAVELGWIGLILNMIFLFVVLRTGIYYYIRCEDPTIKNIYLALTVALFMLMVANYPQEAIIQLPTSLVFYVMLAMLVRLKDFDNKQPSTEVTE